MPARVRAESAIETIDMGLFDLFKSKGKAEPGSAPALDKNVARLAKLAGDKHAQNYDRIEAIDSLARLANGEAAAALLRRFTFHIDPSITDQEEKDAAARGIQAAGEAAIEPIRTFCLKAESLTWPLKLLKDLVDSDRYVQEVIQLLERFDTEYTRNIDPKQQLIAELENYSQPAVRPAVERFLDDASEGIRFVAVATIFAQEDEGSLPALVKTLVAEESLRVKMRIAEGLAARAWTVPADQRDQVRQALPSAVHRRRRRSRQAALASGWPSASPSTSTPSRRHVARGAHRGTAVRGGTVGESALFGLARGAATDERRRDEPALELLFYSELFGLAGM